MIEQNPIIVAVLALLALPGVTSFIASLIRKLTDAGGVKPEVVVYLASLLVTGALVVSGGVDLPAWAGDPVAFVAAWLAYGTANAELARRVYELLWQRLAVA